jgi:acyl-CoA reductase-like NAD-dependent aldehyde dehydrogenase
MSSADCVKATTAKVLAPAVGLLGVLLRKRCYTAPKPITAKIQEAQRPTTSKEIDSFFEDLKEGAELLRKMDLGARASLAQEMLQPMLSVHRKIAEVTAALKGTAEVGIGEETILWAVNLQYLKQYEHALRCNGTPDMMDQRETSNEGETAVKVFPSTLFEHLLFPGWKGEVWVEGSNTQRPSQSALLRERVLKQEAPISVILAAGNQITCITGDIFLKLFEEGCVCLVKVNPVNDCVAAQLEVALAPLISRKLVRLVYGGVDVATYCINHPCVKELHMTGSDKTYNAIVWKNPAGPAPGKTLEDRVFKKPFTAELGAVTPFIVCPGSWTERGLSHYAKSTISMKLRDGSSNCCSPQVLVTCRSWPQRSKFLQYIRDELKAAHCRSPWYPGRRTLLKEWLKDHPFEAIGRDFPDEGLPSQKLLSTDTNEGLFPCLFMTDVSPTSDSPFFKEEFFAPALIEVALDCSESDFLTKAVDFANEKLWGTLSCALYAPPSFPKEAVEEAVAGLRYGSINVNTPTAMGFTSSPCTWGGFKGHTALDIQSGEGVVHNTLLLDNVVKSVMWAPFGELPYTPFWWYDHRNLPTLGLEYGKFCAYPNLYRFVRLVLNGLRG